MRRVRRWGMGVVVAMGAVVLPLATTTAAGASTAAGTAAAVAGSGCNEYAPTTLALSASHATAGSNVTVSGVAVPGNTIQVWIGQVTFTQIGSTTAGPTGAYSTSVTIPALAPGVYTIRILAPGCPVLAAVSFVVDPGPPVTTTTAAPTTTTAAPTTTTAAPTTTTAAPTTTTAAPTTTTAPPSGGTCAANPTLVKRKQIITFTMLSGYKTTASVTLYLQAQFLFGPILTLYSGPYPPGGTVTVTIPNSAPDGQYLFTQNGTATNGTPLSKNCGVKVQGVMPSVVAAVLGEQLGSPVATVASGSSSSVSAKVALAKATLASSEAPGSTPRPLVVLLVVVVSAGALVLLRTRRRA